MNELDKIQLFERHFRGQLTEQERAYLAQDAELLREASSYEAIFQGFEALHLEELQSNMQTWEADLSQASQTKPNLVLWVARRYRLWNFAALLVISLGLGFWFLKDNSQLAKPKLERFQPLMANLLRDVKADESPEEQARKQALSLYNSQDYAQAAEKLQAFLSHYPHHAEAQYCYAVSLMQIKAYDQAQAAFEQLLNKPSAYQIEAEWMLIGLAHKRQNWQDYQNRLEKILRNPEHPKHKTADTLLKELHTQNFF